MTQSKANRRNYALIKLISRQPIKLGRLVAGLVAGLVTRLPLSKISKIIRLNIKIALPNLTETEYQQLSARAIRNELTAYFEFLSIWGSANEKILSAFRLL